MGDLKLQSEDEFNKNWPIYAGRCKPLAEELMAASNGRLRLARGHYYDPIIGERAHWWCVDKTTGAIEDPTKLQFPSMGTAEYVEFDGWIVCEVCSERVEEKQATFAGSHAYCSNECAYKDVMG